MKTPSYPLNLPIDLAELTPANVTEADLAAQCMAARAQAEEILGLIRRHAGDIELVIKLNTQYTAMVRTSLAVHDHLLREQARRRKREETHGAAAADDKIREYATGMMLRALYEEPETSQKSHPVENETPMRQPAAQVPVSPRVQDQGAADRASDRSRRGRWVH